jgi:dTDP-4-dehydrorhamnose reductase
MKILILGANGQLGRELTVCAGSFGLEAVGLDVESIDITDVTSVGRAVSENSPAVVINAAAYTAVDQAESDPAQAFAVNRDGPAHVATVCARAKIPLIHVSTDFVFDGQKGAPYVETDAVNPLSVYGLSKSEGEVGIRSCLVEHIILRTSWLYSRWGKNFVKTMLQLGREREILKVVDDQRGSPTHAADLAGAVLTIATQVRDKPAPVPWGTYHFCGGGETSWHGFAVKIFELAGHREAFRVKEVEPIKASEYPSPARRPAYSVLDCSLIKSAFGIAAPPWTESLARMMDGLYEASQL